MIELSKNQVKTLYICVHPEMYSGGEHHASHCAKIIGQAVDDKSIALVMIPQLEIPRTIESVRRQMCSPNLTLESSPWLSASALNDIEKAAQNLMGQRFWYGNQLFDFAVRNSDFEEKKAKAFAEIQKRFNVRFRSLNEYRPKELYLFERTICFGEDMSSCVPVLARALAEYNVSLESHTSS